MSLQDKTLTCQDCGQTFTFTVKEQEFFQSKGFTNEPKRCLNCRQVRKDNQAPRQMFDGATCKTCGVAVSLPFAPKPDGTYYCREHYTKVK